MQTNIRTHIKFAEKLPGLKKKWHDFFGEYGEKNENIKVFNKRNLQIRSTRYWFYLLHTTGADCWNFFVKYCIQKDGFFGADFSGFIFDESVNFERFNLENVDFSDTFFKVPANFRGAKFSKTANFSTSTFSQKANFQDTYFEHAIFAHSRFQDTANFSKSQFQEANFNQAVFQKTTNFSGADFKKLYFVGTVFSPELDFSRATFYQELNLRESNLQQVENILFEKTKFLKQTDFQKCNFLVVSFSGAEFQQAVDFSDANFQKKANFSGVKFLQEARFLKTTFHQEIYFSNVICEKKTSFAGSIFYQNADFQGLQSNGELYFNDTLFKEEAIFRNYQSKNFTSFKKACFEQLVELRIDENHDKQLIDFTEVQIQYNPKTKWAVDYGTLLKIQQLRHLAWRLQDKKLNRNLSQLERRARRGVKINQLFSQIKRFWRTDKKDSGFWDYFLKPIFFIFFAIPWSIRFLLFWPLGQLSVFFYGTRSYNNYIRGLFFLILSYPVFYFLYTQTALQQEGIVLGSCNRNETYTFILQHYLPFVDNWTSYLQNCFAGAIPLKTYNIVVAQSIFSILITFFTLPPLLENISSRIRSATKKTVPSAALAVPKRLNPAEETATLTLPGSDTTPVGLGEQPSLETRKIRDEYGEQPSLETRKIRDEYGEQPSLETRKIRDEDGEQPSPETRKIRDEDGEQPSLEIRKIRDEDIVGSPDTTKTASKAIISPLAKPVETPVVNHKPHLFVPDPDSNLKTNKQSIGSDTTKTASKAIISPLAKPVETPVVNHKPHLFVPDPDFNFKTNKQSIYFEKNFKKRFSSQWPHPLLKSLMKENKIQEPKVVTQINKTEEKRRTFRSAEYNTEKT